MTDDLNRTGKGDGEAGEAQPPERLPETLEEALGELARLKEEAALNYDRWLRAAAEAENVRRRCEREKGDYLKYATESLIRELLPVVDNLERALGHAEGNEGCEALQRGVELTLKGLKDALERQGVVAVEALGKPFDPSLHEAVSVEERPQAGDNEVVEQLQRGYMLKDRLIRPALVVVAKAAGPAPEPGPEDEGAGGADE